MNAETKAALDALTDPNVRSEIAKLIADSDDEAQDPNRDDAVGSLEEWVLRRNRDGDTSVRLEGVDWYAVVEALETNYSR